MAISGQIHFRALGAHTNTDHMQLFLDFYVFKIWPPNFCVSTILQVIWPSPGTLLALVTHRRKSSETK